MHTGISPAVEAEIAYRRERIVRDFATSGGLRSGRHPRWPHRRGARHQRFGPDATA